MGGRPCGYKYKNPRPAFCSYCTGHFIAIRDNHRFCTDRCRNRSKNQLYYIRRKAREKEANRPAPLRGQDPGADCCYRGMEPGVQAGECTEVHSSVPGDRLETR